MTASEHEMAAETTRVLDQLTTKYSRSPHAHSVKGHILSLFGRSAEARECWQRSLELDPRFAQAHRQIGGTQMENGEYAEAVESLQAAIAIDSSAPGLANQLADALMHAGQPAEALRVLTEGIRQGPPVARTHYLLGQIQLQLNDYEAAHRHLLQAIEEDPQDTAAYYALTQASARLGNREEAQQWREQLKSIKEVVDAQGVIDMRAREDRSRVRGYMATAYLEAGKVYQLFGDAASAEDHWLMAAAYLPNNVESRTALARLYLPRQQLAKLVKVERQLAEIDPANPQYALDLGNALFKAANYSQAEEQFQRCIQLAGSWDAGYRALTLLYVETGDPRAGTMAQQAISLAPTAENHFLAALAWQAAGDTARAVQAINHAISLDPSNHAYHQALETIQP